MSAGQELLPRRSLAERFAPPVSIPAPSPSALPVVLQGGDPCWATLAANLPNDTFTTASNCGCDGHKNPDANARFLLDLTLFRMNTCTKRVGGWGLLAQPLFRQRSSLGLCCHHEGRPRGKVCLAPKEVRPEGSAVGVFGCRIPFTLSVEGFTLPALLALSLEGSLVSTARPRPACNCTPGAVALQCGSRFR
jgi:hypothetical protein